MNIKFQNKRMFVNKLILSAMVVIVLLIPVTQASAQNTIEEQYRSVLIQLIASLQRQIFLLSSQEASIINGTDRCPNLDGIQISVPSNLVYSRSFDKCVTAQQLDTLEDEEKVCSMSKSEVSELHERSAEISDEMEVIKEIIPEASKGAPIELDEEHVTQFLSSVGFRVGNQVSENCGESGRLCKAGFYYSDEVIQKRHEFSLLRSELKELNIKLDLAEVKVIAACR